MELVEDVTVVFIRLMMADIPLERGIPDTISWGIRVALKREAEFVEDGDVEEKPVFVAGMLGRRWKRSSA